MFCQWSIDFRISFNLLPFRIGLERSPILLRFFAARMFKDVHKEVLRVRSIFRTPITDTLHVVSLENSGCMIAEASYQRIHLALINAIEAQLVDVMRRLRSGKAGETRCHCDASDKR